jgi:hypothetical protein
LLPRTPWIRQIYGTHLPGAAIRVVGGGFGTSSGGVRVDGLAHPYPVLAVSPNELWFRVPANHVANSYESLRIAVASDSPLTVPDTTTPSRRRIVSAATHEGGSPISVGSPLRPGQAFTLLVSGDADPSAPCTVTTIPYTTPERLRVIRIEPGPLPGLTAIVIQAPDDVATSGIRSIDCGPNPFAGALPGLTSIIVPVADR